MVNFAYQNVPYYHKLFNRLGLNPGDIRTVKDLEKLPFLNKEIINKNPDDFKPLHLKRIKYTTAATGGTTGTPLQYRLSGFDRFLGGALLYRGWGYGGYQLGDRMVFLAGLVAGYRQSVIPCHPGPRAGAKPEKVVILRYGRPGDAGICRHYQLVQAPVHPWLCIFAVLLRELAGEERR